MYVAKHLFINNLQLNIAKEVSRNLPRIPKRAIDPGIQRRKKLIDNDDESLDLSNYDYDLESDFSNVGNSYKEHLYEINKERERIRKFITKQKYFKEKTPNFLTWNDKEQIRYLHNTNPEEWTIEKLSEGFPALPHIIAKIVKPRMWEKSTVKKIQDHDKSVQKNWELFKENKLNLNNDLTDHLKKFSDRNLNLNPIHTTDFQQNKPKIKNIKVGTEFSDIITSYEKLKKKDEETIHDSIKFTETSRNKTKSETYTLSDKFNKHDKHITLQELQNKIIKKSLSGPVNIDEQELLKESKNKTLTLNENKTINKLPSEMVNTQSTKSVMVHRKKPANDYLLQYPEKIIIPKEKQKPGCTYKLNDCYYDDDGLFLYRVPGMYK